MNSIKELFGQNSLLLSGILLSLVASVGWWIKDTIPQFLKFLSRYFISSVEVDSRDTVMFDTLLAYMHERKALQNINQFSAKVLKSYEWQSLADDLKSNHTPQINLTPAKGFHLFKLNGKLMWMNRDLQVSSQVFETITLKCFGRDKVVLENIIQKALEDQISKELNKVAVYLPNPSMHGSGEWNQARLGNQRHLSTIILKKGQALSILVDLQKFFSSKKRYEDLGIAWRRGYLLYGVPGTGKTSLVMALACELRLNVCALSLAANGITDDKIGALLSNIPPRSLILIEDVDAFFHEREQQIEQVKLSFSGFLNALDGVAAHEGSVVFMTTNRYETLDAALIRSGRIDFRIELTNCDSYQMEGMFRKFFDDEKMAKLFAQKLVAQGKIWSPATIQELLLKSDTIEEAFKIFGL